MPLNVDALSCLKVKELQRELKKRGLDTSGLKAVLLERLKERLQQEETLETHKDETRETEEEETTEVSDSPEKQEEALSNAVELEKERGTENGGRDDQNETSVGLKRPAEASEDPEMAKDAKKLKRSTTKTINSPQPEDEDGKSVPNGDAEAHNKVEGDTAMYDKTTSTIRIDNFVRPFTLNAVKELVQEFGCFVDEGFWMDAIKTHCFVTYLSSEIAEKARSALDGKIWPPENGRSLSVKLTNCTAMEVAQHGEANIPDQLKSKNSSGAQSTQRPKVTIDEFFQKTETKPVLYYLPLTDEQIKQKKERRGQQSEGQPRKRRHRGGRKRNRRARFRRR